MKSPKLFMLAGEHSGDLHGSALIPRLREQLPHLQLFGVGGPQMRAQGFSDFLPMEQFQVFGFTEIVKKLPRLLQQFYAVRSLILQEQPEGVLLIDYPGFNLRLGRSLRKKGYRGKIIQYICPTVWAWGKSRIQVLADYFDLLLTIFPFEPPLFAHTSLPTTFVGHPLIDRLRHYSYDPDWRAKCGILPDARSLALFPGSRPEEIYRLFPRQLAAAFQVREADSDLDILVSSADEKIAELLRAEIAKTPGRAPVHLVPRQFSYELMRDCHTALAKSGTVTLELALHHKPCAVVYEVSRLNALMARYLFQLRLPYFCIVNILTGKSVYPEFIQQPFTAEELGKTLLKLHEDTKERAQAIQGCFQAEAALKTTHDSSAERAACAVRQTVWG